MEDVVKVIEVIQMKKKEDWVDAYFTPEQQKTMRTLSDASYSDEAKEKMKAWPTWTAEDQKRVDAECLGWSPNSDTWSRRVPTRQATKRRPPPCRRT